MLPLLRSSPGGHEVVVGVYRGGWLVGVPRLVYGNHNLNFAYSTNTDVSAQDSGELSHRHRVSMMAARPLRKKIVTEIARSGSTWISLKQSIVHVGYYKQMYCLSPVYCTNSQICRGQDTR